LSDKVEYKKQLSMLYSKLKIWDKAFIYNQQLMQLKDSLAKDENLRISHDLENKYNVAQKEKQILILNKDKQLQQKEIQRQRLLQYATLSIAAIFLLFGSVFLFQRIRIAREKKKSDGLLLNILPKQTADELKASGKTEAKYYETCSILFTDFENFTSASEQYTPQQLVSEIDMCYSAFDNILLKYNIEKIKTIGDSYMCVAGLPETNKNHARDILNAALEMRNFMSDLYIERKRKNERCFKIRIGINSGPLVAGVVGSSKFAYDVWGDAVNIASRMESSSETGKVNISGSTYELVKDNFVCTYRGKIAVKNKGEIDMYFAENLR
jgi:class 3 adenylate cyclase